MQDLYIDDVHSWVHDSGWAHQRVPLSFVELIFRWMLEHSGDEYPVYPLSFVELAFLYNDIEPAQYPFGNPTSQQFEISVLGYRFERPTLSQLLSIVRRAAAVFLRFLGSDHVVFRSRNKVELKATKPLDGIFMHFHQTDPAKAQAGQDLVKSFCGHQPLRKACDFARSI